MTVTPFELRWPDEVTDLKRFTPSVCPVIEGYTINDEDGILAQVMADGRTMYTQQIGDPVREFSVPFRSLTDTDKAQFEDFRSSALGGTFKMKDGNTGGYMLVRFAPDAFVRKWAAMQSISGAVRWAVTLAFRQVGVAGGVNIVSWNDRGFATISGTSNEVVVTFGTAQADTSYVVAFGVEGQAGEAIQTPRIKPGTKSTTGFTIELSAAPGAGNNVRVDWIVSRV